MIRQGRPNLVTGTAGINGICDVERSVEIGTRLRERRREPDYRFAHMALGRALSPGY